MKNKLPILFIFLTIALALSACAPLPQQESYAPAIAVAPVNAAPGATITIYGAGFPPATNMEVFIAVAGKEFPQQPLSAAMTDAKGQLKTTFTAPQLDDSDKTTLVVFVQTVDKATFATSSLTLEAEHAAVAISPTAIPVPEVSPTPGADAGEDKTCQTETDKTKSATVASETLNVRFGPGTKHQIVTTLASGDQVEMKGRTADSAWVEVILSDCRGGWVYAVYLKTAISIASLPFTAGAGGPVSDSPSGAPDDGKSGVWISIENNVANVTVKGMPSDQNVTLSLTADNKTLPDFATNVANSSGTANFKFTMPAKWSDGTAITQSNLWLLATSSDGTTKSVEVIYYR